MTLFVETPKRTLDLEIATLDLPGENAFEALYKLGAMNALQWVRDGGNRPSEIVARAKVPAGLVQ